MRPNDVLRWMNSAALRQQKVRDDDQICFAGHVSLFASRNVTGLWLPLIINLGWTAHQFAGTSSDMWSQRLKVLRKDGESEARGVSNPKRGFILALRTITYCIRHSPLSFPPVSILPKSNFESLH